MSAGIGAQFRRHQIPDSQPVLGFDCEAFSHSRAPDMYGFLGQDKGGRHRRAQLKLLRHLG